MLAAGVAVGQIGIGAFHPHGKVGGHEQVKNAVNTIGRNALAALCRYQLRYVIGRGRARKSRKRVEYRGACIGPLLARRLQIMTCGISERFAVMLMMIMFSHKGNLGMIGWEGKFV